MGDMWADLFQDETTIQVEEKPKQSERDSLLGEVGIKTKTATMGVSSIDASVQVAKPTVQAQTPVNSTPVKSNVLEEKVDTSDIFYDSKRVKNMVNAMQDIQNGAKNLDMQALEAGITSLTLLNGKDENTRMNKDIDEGIEKIMQGVESLKHLLDPKNWGVSGEGDGEDGDGDDDDSGDGSSGSGNSSGSGSGQEGEEDGDSGGGGGSSQQQGDGDSEENEGSGKGTNEDGSEESEGGSGTGDDGSEEDENMGGSGSDDIEMDDGSDGSSVGNPKKNVTIKVNGVEINADIVEDLTSSYDDPKEAENKAKNAITAGREWARKTEENAKKEAEKINIGGKGIGHGTSLQGLINEIEYQMSNLVDWREALEDFCEIVQTPIYSRKYEVKQFRMNGVLGTSRRAGYKSHKQLVHIIVGIDVSGSIDNITLQRYLGEIESITNEYPDAEIEIVYWADTVVYARTFVGEKELKECAIRPGCGGTDVKQFFKYLCGEYEVDYKGGDFEKGEDLLNRVEEMDLYDISGVLILTDGWVNHDYDFEYDGHKLSEFLDEKVLWVLDTKASGAYSAAQFKPLFGMVTSLDSKNA